jgi:hypothetical protein
MRIALDLPSTLVHEAESRAEAEGRTLDEYVEEALRARLSQEAADAALPVYRPRRPGALVDLDDKNAVEAVLDGADS